MRILFVTQFFHPEPFFRGLPFAKALLERGHQVEVLTGFPNYPGGQVYDGYRIRPLQRETIDGVPVIRVPLFPSHDRSSVRRSLNYLSFLGSAATLGPATVTRADVAYVYHPPITTGMAAVALRGLRGIPFVYDVQDLWPDALATTRMFPPRLMRPLGAACQLVYRQAARITVLSPGFKRALVSRGLSPRKIEVIYNWCDEAALVAPAGEADVLDPRDADGLDGRFNVVFAGNMGSAQGLDAVLEAARLLRDDRPRVQLVLMGGGVDRERLVAAATRMGLTNLRFLSYRPQREAGRVLRRADALLVHLRDAPLFEITIPSKTQAYMAQGKPLIMAVRGDAADLVRRSGAGVTCAPESPTALAAAVRRLHDLPPEERDAMGARAKRFYERELSAAAGCARFERIFAEVARERGNGRREDGRT